MAFSNLQRDPAPGAQPAPAPAFGKNPAIADAERPKNIRYTTEAVGKTTFLTPEYEKTLCGLAALQIRYGKSQEAIAYLMMIRRENPTNKSAMRLLIVALMNLERWDEANQILDELGDTQNDNPILNRLSALYRSVIALRTARFADAKAWFKRFRTLTMGTTS